MCILRKLNKKNHHCDFSVFNNKLIYHNKVLLEQVMKIKNCNKKFHQQICTFIFYQNFCEMEKPKLNNA